MVNKFKAIVVAKCRQTNYQQEFELIVRQEEGGDVESKVLSMVSFLRPDCDIFEIVRMKKL